MTGRPAIIDLGVLPPDGAIETPAPRSVRDWLSDRARHPVPWAAAALAVLLMLTVTAAAAPSPPWLVPHLTIPGGSLGRPIIADDRLYVFDRTPDGLVMVTAYRLTDGTVRWQASAEEAHVWDGVPVLRWSGEDGSGGRSAWLDPETGEPHPGHNGDPVAVTGDRLIFAARDRELGDEDIGRQAAYRLAVVDRQTNSRALAVSAETWALTDPRSGAGNELLVVPDNAQLSSYDVRTGATVATTPTVESDRPMPVQVVGRVVLLQPRESDSTLTAYDVDTLSRLWTEDLGGYIRQVARCGRRLCIQDGGSTVRRSSRPPASWRGQRPGDPPGFTVHRGCLVTS